MPQPRFMLMPHTHLRMATSREQVQGTWPVLTCFSLNLSPTIYTDPEFIVANYSQRATRYRNSYITPWDAVIRTELCVDATLHKTLPQEPQQEEEHEKGGEHSRKCSDSKTWTSQTEKRTDGEGNGLGKWSVISTRILHRCEKDEGWKDLKGKREKMRFLMLVLRMSGFQWLRRQGEKHIHCCMQWNISESIVCYRVTESDADCC